MTTTPTECTATMTPNPIRPRRWCVVGGGFLGMTVAYRLAQNGHRVTLIEAQPELGGLASAWELGTITWDRHYHVTLLSDRFTRGLLNELGIEQEVEWVETKTGFYSDGELSSISNAIEYLQLPALRLIDKLRLAATIVYASRITDWRKLESIPVSDWLIRLSGRRTFERLWLPLLRSKLGENYKHASAAFIWSTIARLYAARRTGLKKEMFGYVQGGYDRTISCLAQRLTECGVQIHCDHPVGAIMRRGDRLCIESTDGTSDEFDDVVVTTSCSIASRLCEQLNSDEHSRLNNIQYMGIVCASLLLDQPLADYYLTYLTDAWVPFTAVVEMSAMVDASHLGGHSLVYLPKYVAAGDALTLATDREVESKFLGALEHIYPDFQRSSVKAFRVSRVRDVFAIPSLNYSQCVPPLETSVPHLYLANSAQIVNGTLNVNETIQLAERSAQRLLRVSADASPIT